MALVRASPGMRKNGAGGSPRTEVTEAMPSSISCSALMSGILWSRSGWVWLWVPMVWPAAATLRTTSG